MKRTILYSLMLLAGAATLGATENDAATASIAADTTRTEISDPIRLDMPVELTGRDLVTKVYGVLTPDQACSKEACRANCQTLLQMVPEEDEYGLWLEDHNGYCVSCYGISPETSAMADYDGNQLSHYGFFFLFPYTNGQREAANRRQAEFCGALLQELNDMGLTLRAASDTPALFDVVGENGADSVEIRLIEETDSQEPAEGQLAGTADSLTSTPGTDGRFILILSIDPGASALAVTD